MRRMSRMNTQDRKSRVRIKPVDGEILSAMKADMDAITEAWNVLQGKLTAAEYEGERFPVEAGGMGPEVVGKLRSWINRTTQAFIDRKKPKAAAALKEYDKKQAKKKKSK